MPVSEIEEYEKVHGPDSGGTMADPKNTKPKSPIPNERDKEPSPAYNKVQLQGNNDSGDPDNEDSIGIKNRLCGPPKRTRAGRPSSNMSLS